MVAVDTSKARAELESEHLRLREETARSLQTLKGELEERAQRLTQELSALQQERQSLAEQKTMLDAMLENIQQEAQALDAKKEKAQAAPLGGVSASTPSPEELQRLAASEQNCKELLEKLRASEARLAGRESEFKELSGKLEAEARKVSQLQKDSSLDEDLLREVDRLENENRALAQRLNRPWQEVLKEASSQWAT
jgi:DNA repair exonuclease SbcCD ATPase subunit